MFKTLENLNKNFYAKDLLDGNIRKCKCCFLPENLIIEDNLYLASHSLVNIEKVFIGDDGMCNFCSEYQKKLNVSLLENERKFIVENNKKTLLLFSGGKDSVWTFNKLIDLGLDFDGFFYDNGFIPENIISNSKKLFEKFNKKLFIEKEVLNLGENVCINCSKNLNKILKKYVANQKYELIIYGNNYTNFESDGFLSSFYSSNGIIYLNFPFLYQNTYLDLITYLKEKELIGNINFNLKGNSTNCLAIGYEIEKTSNKNISFLSELVYMSLEKRFGFFTELEFKDKLIKIFPNFEKYF